MSDLSVLERGDAGRTNEERRGRERARSGRGCCAGQKKGVISGLAVDARGACAVRTQGIEGAAIDALKEIRSCKVLTGAARGCSGARRSRRSRPRGARRHAMVPAWRRTGPHRSDQRGDGRVTVIFSEMVRCRRRGGTSRSDAMISSTCSDFSAAIRRARRTRRPPRADEEAERKVLAEPTRARCRCALMLSQKLFILNDMSLATHRRDAERDADAKRLHGD